MMALLAPPIVKKKDLDERIFFRKKLISSLKEIKELSKENLKHKEQLHDYELENEKLRKKKIDLHAQQREATRLNMMFTTQLNERGAYCERLHSEVVSLRHDLERENKRAV